MEVADPDLFEATESDRPEVAEPDLDRDFREATELDLADPDLERDLRSCSLLLVVAGDCDLDFAEPDRDLPVPVDPGLDSLDDREFDFDRLLFIGDISVLMVPESDSKPFIAKI